jgi:hypothetical protein
MFLLSGSGRAREPSKHAIAALCGFPASELVVVNITEQEQKVMASPGLFENIQDASVPSSESIYEAYRVQGKQDRTFFPLQIYIARRGTFLSSRVVSAITAADEQPGGYEPGGKGPFGSLRFALPGKGGVYFGDDLKTPGNKPGWKYPQTVAALMSVFQPDGVDSEVKIAILAALPGGRDLIEVPGGEKYFEAFRQSEPGESKPRPDLAALFRGLTDLVAADVVGRRPSSTPTSPPATSSQLTNHNIPDGHSPNAPPQPGQDSSAAPEIPSWWAWWMLAILVSITISIIKLRRKSRS